MDTLKSVRLSFERLSKLNELVVELRDSMALQEAIVLRDTDVAAPEILLISAMLMAFNVVIHMCFGSALLSGYMQSIAKFRSLFEEIEPLRIAHPVWHATDVCKGAGCGPCITSKHAHETVN